MYVYPYIYFSLELHIQDSVYEVSHLEQNIPITFLILFIKNYKISADIQLSLHGTKIYLSISVITERFSRLKVH